MGTVSEAPRVGAGPHAGAYRPPAIGRTGVVAAAHVLAATAGLRMLFDGGTAVDAAVAVGATLGVVEPFMSGIGGGGGFMLIYEAATRKVHALDYLGPAPAAADATAFSTIDDIDTDVRSATVPSLLAGWLAAHEHFGRLERSVLFQPAIDLAEQGWPISRWAAGIFSTYAPRLRRHAGTAGGLLPGGEAPLDGAVLTQPDLARSYRHIAQHGADALYYGDLGRRLAAAVRSAGGWLCGAELAQYTPVWREPLAVDYAGWRVHCPPPPSSGFQYLECLNMLAASDLRSLGHNSADYLHVLLETIKLASADRTCYASAEPGVIRALLSPEYAAQRSASIDPQHAAPSEGERFVGSKHGQVAPGEPRGAEHTTYFEVADRWGNLVAVTQSNGAPFGSGFVAGDTGIVLNNFLYWTDLDPRSPNFLQGGQQQRDMPMAPCMVTRDGSLRLGIGTPGSYGILQTTLQMVLNSLTFDMHVQAAIEAPRVRAFEGTRVDVERRVDRAVVKALASRRHDVRVLDDWTWAVGSGHGIAVDAQHGVLSGGADPRRDGAAVAF